jgi:hypothetical protein
LVDVIFFILFFTFLDASHFIKERGKEKKEKKMLVGTRVRIVVDYQLLHYTWRGSKEYY